MQQLNLEIGIGFLELERKLERRRLQKLSVFVHWHKQSNWSVKFVCRFLICKTLLSSLLHCAALDPRAHSRSNSPSSEPTRTKAQCWNPNCCKRNPGFVFVFAIWYLFAPNDLSLAGNQDCEFEFQAMCCRAVLSIQHSPSNTGRSLSHCSATQLKILHISQLLSVGPSQLPCDAKFYRR